MMERSLFSKPFQATMGPEDFEKLIQTIERVPFLEEQLNEYFAHSRNGKGGLITVGPSGEGSYCSGNKIVLEEYRINGSNRDRSDYFEAICLTLGHEATHGLDPDLNIRSSSNPMESAEYGLMSEGKALETEFRISKAFGISLRNTEDQAALDAITEEKGLRTDIPEPERIKAGRDLYSRHTPSGLYHTTTLPGILLNRLCASAGYP